MTVSFFSGADPRPHASYTQIPASGCDKVISERSASATDEAVYSTCADRIEKADTETVIFLEELAPVYINNVFMCFFLYATVVAGTTRALIWRDEFEVDGI